MDLYDENLEKIFIIDHEKLESNKNQLWNLIEIPEKPDVIVSDHEYFCIHDDLFDRTQSTRQDRNITWRLIPNEPNGNASQYEVTKIHYDKIQNKKRNINKKSTKHNIQRKR